MQSNDTTPGREFAMQLVAMALAALIAAPASAGKCADIPNGSFGIGFIDWTATPDTFMADDAFAEASAEIIDGTKLFPPMDADVAQLTSISAVTGVTAIPRPGPGTASATMRLQRSATVADRFLRFEIGGGGEVFVLGNGEGGYELRVAVQGPRGESIDHPVDELVENPGFPCNIGFALLFLFGLDDPFVIVDLFENGGTPTGIELGDEITLEVILTTFASSASECDDTNVSAQLLVDNFQFCPNAPSDADLNGDGVVDGLDLGILLANWSIPAGSPGCGKKAKECPSDLNGDGVVDGLDLGILLANWTIATKK